MACDATARLYDVDEKTVVFRKLDKTKRYDQGTITFRARNGKLIDLDKLHESIWATRLSGRTSSGLVTLQVTAVGEVIRTANGVRLIVAGSDAEFVLAKSRSKKEASVFAKLQAVPARGKRIRVTGVIDDYQGRWPQVLSRLPVNPRRILVTSFKPVE